MTVLITLVDREIDRAIRVVGAAGSQHHRGVPTWVKVSLLVLLVGALLLLPGVLEWGTHDSAGYLVVAAGGLLGVGAALGRRYRRVREVPDRNSRSCSPVLRSRGPR